MLNSEQQDYVECLNKLPADQKCGCGWFTRDECIRVHCNGGARPEDAEASKWFKLGVKQAQERHTKKLNATLDRLVTTFGSACSDYATTRMITSTFAYHVKLEMK